MTMLPPLTPRGLPMRIESPVRRRSLISLTPLIDVVFILLVFFMLASSFLDWRAIDLDMPPPHEYGLEADHSLEVLIAADGTLTLEGEALARDALVREVAAAVRSEPERAVIVRPAGEVRLQTMVDLVERLARAGVTNVSLRPEVGE